MPGLMVLPQFVPLDRKFRARLGGPRLPGQPRIAAGRSIGLDEALDGDALSGESHSREIDVDRQGLRGPLVAAKDRTGPIGPRLARERIVEERPRHIVAVPRRPAV